MTAEKQGDKLTVNAKDNTGDARVGQIVVTSSEGEKTAKIAVSQKAGSENPARARRSSVRSRRPMI